MFKPEHFNRCDEYLIKKQNIERKLWRELFFSFDLSFVRWLFLNWTIIRNQKVINDTESTNISANKFPMQRELNEEKNEHTHTGE